jgi:putative membrane protein
MQGSGLRPLLTLVLTSRREGPKARMDYMPGRTRAPSLRTALVIAGVGGAALALSPAILTLIGWSGGGDLARLDPLLSLCLASRPGVEPGHLLASWSLAPQIVLPFLLVSLLYGQGVLAERRQGGPKPARIGMFAGGMLLLAVALFSPLCRLAATLASAHMVQHVLIVAVIPPMLILGQPLMTMRRGLRGAVPLGIPGWLDRPALASAAYAGAIWLSHAPIVYEAALVDPTIHLLLLAFQLGAGLLFWRIILRCVSGPKAERDQAGPALLMTFSTFMHTGLLGALLTFASAPWYPIYGSGPQAFGLTPLEDQQLAGLIMWVPMCGVFLAAGLAVMAKLLKVEETSPG